MEYEQLNDEVRKFFPYKKTREKQGEAINRIYQELSETNKHVVIFAPNGYGKTILGLASVLPIVKIKDKKLIYLCRTHTQIQRVIEELLKINSELQKNDENLQLSGIGLRGRNSMCFHPAVMDLRDHNLSHITCIELRKNNKCLFYNNVKRHPEKVDFLLSTLEIKPIDGSELIETCRDYDFCPYIISKSLLEKADVIACNYQWIINPYIRANLLDSINAKLNDIILIIDEAHNIPDISTEIDSSSLTKYTVEVFIDECRNYGFSFFKKFGEILKKIYDDLSKNKSEELKIIPEYIIKKFDILGYINKDFFINMVKTGKNIRDMKLRAGKHPYSSIFTVGNFFLKWINSMDKDNYCFLATKYRTERGRPGFKLEIISLDPKKILEPIFSEVYASLHMSGTINPNAYIDVVGLPETAVQLNLPALWKKENVKVIAIKGITSKGTSRTEQMFKQMLKHIKIAIDHTPKNIGIFTASYDILKSLLDAGFDKIQTNKRIFIENPKMKSAENDEMIRHFKEASQKDGGILLGVCGGRNAEGEDFPGDYMNTVIICGIPFARPTVRVQAFIDYYIKHYGTNKGRDISYNIPAFRRANQAAGRAIRTLNDRGVIILMDYRYSTKYFKRFLANWIKERIKVIENDPALLKNELLDFYGLK
ncbi:MAG: helicase C-terminal domain-containing protein [Candidatus Helarchaeota archaeon]